MSGINCRSSTKSPRSRASGGERAKPRPTVELDPGRGRVAIRGEGEVEDLLGTPIRVKLASVRMNRDKLTLLARAVIRRVGAKDDAERRAWIRWLDEALGDRTPAPLTWSMCAKEYQIHAEGRPRTAQG